MELLGYYFGASIPLIPFIALIYFICHIIASKFKKKVLLTYVFGIVVMYLVLALIGEAIATLLFSVLWFVIIERLVALRKKKAAAREEAITE